MSGGGGQGRVAERTVLQLRQVHLPHMLEQTGDVEGFRRSGSAWKGLCPFHDEKTPSFSVFQSQNGDWRYNCFGCQQTGDAIDFTMAMNPGLTFRDAVEVLADRQHIQVDYDTPDDTVVVPRGKIWAINAAAQEWFTANLAKTPAAQQILADRGFGVQDAARFGVGYAPAKGLVAALRGRFELDELVEAGVASRLDDGTVIDVFRNRITWPISHVPDRIMGFGGRRDSDDYPEGRAPGKYLNTRQTSVYDKTHTLFNLDQAREPATQARMMLLVEGYTDVMAWAAAGVPNVVATCGTSVTEHHVDTIARVVGTGGGLVVVTDDDDAGRRAMIKVVGQTAALDLRVLALPGMGSMDPADIFRVHGRNRLRDILDQRRPAVQVVVDRIIADKPAESVDERIALANTVAQMLAWIPDSMVRDVWARDAAVKIGVSPELLADRAAATGPVAKNNQPSRGPGAGGVFHPEREVMVVAVRSETVTRQLVSDGTFGCLASPKAGVMAGVLRGALETAGADWAARVDVVADRERVAGEVAALRAASQVDLMSAETMRQYVTDLTRRLAAAADRQHVTDIASMVRDTTDPAEKAAGLRMLRAAAKRSA